ncbi:MULTISPECIES: Lrp/AsnC family transcriptional regulator [unclassified Mycobacterium]|uniref:Lrp/AsnC family transcriptional regulator n=1 Tax=unclassified Mycobacterium TaxID=2642494 RepID=UPI0029C6D792|nr:MULTISPECIES: Lrp/AsnC family transcriptional regulator [unclassified Mycobacterium]
MARSEALDELDLKIVQALNLDGRVPFSTIARVIGVSDQTVARRYTQLRSTNAIRVVGRTDPHSIGETSWFVRVRCSPNVALAVGEAMARRPETSWVKLTSGGTEVVAVVRGPAHGDSPSLLLEQLPRTRDVLDVSANCMLHMFFGGTDGVIDALSNDQVAQLRAPAADHSTDVHLDDVDTHILRLLEDDGRAELAELAKASGIAPTTLRRRLGELRHSGVLYFDVDLDYRRLGLASQTILWLTVSPNALIQAGTALAEHPEVAFAAATTGTTNVYANVVCADAPALFEYLTTKVAALPSLQAVESAPVIRTLKRV